MRPVLLSLIVLLVAGSALAGGSLEKAKSLRLNGLLAEAKSELVEIVHDDTAESDVRAEALMVLGEITVDEKNLEAAKDNWGKLVATYNRVGETLEEVRRISCSS